MMRLPEIYWLMAPGAQVVFVPASFVFDADGKDHWEILRARGDRERLLHRGTETN